VLVSRVRREFHDNANGRHSSVSWPKVWQIIQHRKLGIHNLTRLEPAGVEVDVGCGYDL
jgi:hypothetical protein